MPWPGLAGGAALLLAVAWLPGQTSAGALRVWLCAGALPCLILWRGGVRGGLWWALLAASALLGWSGAALALATWQLGWWAALLIGRHAPARAEWIATAGGLAALTGCVAPQGLFGNPDYLAAFVALCVPAAVHCTRTHRRWAALLPIMALALWRADSLGAWVALVAVGCMAVMGARGRRGWALLAGLLVLIGLLGWHQRDTLQRHLDGRRHLFVVSARIATAHPLTGVGAGRFHAAFLNGQARVVERAALWTNAHHAHHEGLHVAAEQGLPAAILLLVPLILAATRRPWGVWHATGAVGVVIGCVNPLLYMPGASFLFGHAIGAALGRAPPISARWRWPGRALGAALLALATHQLMADRLLARADRTQDAALAETAARWSLRPARALRVAAAHHPPDAQALAWAEAANRLDMSVEGVMLRGRILHAMGRHAEATEAFAMAVRLHPWLFAGWFNLARAEEDQGHRAAALRAASRARRLRPSDPRLRHLPR